MSRASLASVVVVAFGLAAPHHRPPAPPTAAEIQLPGLTAPVRVLRDARGVPHVFAENDADLYRVQGWLHANDRFFQMDVNRRTAQGRLAELLGPDALLGDFQVRALDLVGAGQRNQAIASLDPDLIPLGEAYAEGINSWLATHPLPPEYTALEITQVPPWTLLDSQTMGKANNLEIGLMLFQTFDTEILAEYVAALGDAAGRALFAEDVARQAPVDPATTVPDALGLSAPAPASRSASRDRGTLASQASPRSSQLAAAAAAARAWHESWLGRAATERGHAARSQPSGSNAFGVAARASATGSPMVAGDNHGSLTSPAFSYEMHLVVRGDPERGDMDASGATGPGFPAIITPGQNEHVAWAGTFMVADQSDIFLDEVVRGDPACPTPICIRSEGVLHRVDSRRESFSFNDIGNGIVDDFGPGPRLTFHSVPFRSYGPVLQMGQTTALVLQYIGFEAARTGRFLFDRLRARDVFEFREAHRLFQSTASNIVAADDGGHLLHFCAGHIPLRADLEAGVLVGEAPWFVRDGSGPDNWLRDETLAPGLGPFRLVPFDELPRVLDPPRGFVVNTNNDPSGTSLDNDVLNEHRPSNPSAILYLGNFWEYGARAGRLTQLLGARLDAGGRIPLAQLRRIQGNTQPRVAEYLLPHLVSALERASAPGAAPELAALAGDPEVAEAVARLAAWDLASPTGIPEGYDASEKNGVRNPAVSAEEAASSVAATLFRLYFRSLLDLSIRTALAQHGLVEDYPGGSLNGLLYLLSQQPFTGVGASGVDFFPGPAELSAEDRRDRILLAALRDTLDDLAGPEFADAFGGSRHQDDYRWGKLSRVLLAHPLGSGYSIPSAGGFPDLAPHLPGISRDGGCDTVSPGLCGLPPFRFGSRDRFVGAAGHPAARGGVLGFFNLPGGASGDPADPTYASQLGEWLTADHHRLVTDERAIVRQAASDQRFVP
jgi:penicillin amidase